MHGFIAITKDSLQNVQGKASEWSLPDKSMIRHFCPTCGRLMWNTNKVRASSQAMPRLHATLFKGTFIRLNETGCLFTAISFISLLVLTTSPVQFPGLIVIGVESLRKDGLVRR